MKRISNLLIAKIWENQNSQKGQVTVQFVQQVEGAGSNPLLALTQGIDSVSRVTALLSFKKEVVEKYFGTTNFECEDRNNFATYKTVENTPLERCGINVVENTTKNPDAPNQKPKMNPQSGNALADEDGNPIYRHTEVVMEGDLVEPVLMKHAQEIPWNFAEVAVNQNVLAGVDED